MVVAWRHQPGTTVFNTNPRFSNNMKLRATLSWKLHFVLKQSFMHEHFVHLTVTVCTNIAHSSEPETITPGFNMLPANSLLKWTDLAYDQKLARWKQKSNNTRNVSKQASCKQQHSSCWRSCSFRTRSGNCKSHLSENQKTYFSMKYDPLSPKSAIAGVVCDTVYSAHSPGVHGAGTSDGGPNHFTPFTHL